MSLIKSVSTLNCVYKDTFWHGVGGYVDVIKVVILGSPPRHMISLVKVAD